MTNSVITIKALASVLLFAALLMPTTQAQQATVGTTTVADGLVLPWGVAQLPQGDFLVTERGGQLQWISAAGARQTVDMQLPGLFVDAQAGLFEVLLDTDFAQNQQVYLSYACGTAQANATCVSRGRLQLDAGAAALTDLQQIFRASPDKRGSAHYGGRMTWLGDGTLLLTLGDGFDYREQAQNLDSYLGKTVRIHADGSIPVDNPFTHSAAPGVFTYGHRNVQGVVWDAERQLIWQHEHGPKGGDEINLLESGRNYGWPMTSYGVDYTGAKVTPFSEMLGVELPLWVWNPSLAPAGLAVYYGSQYPDWQGDLLVAHLAGKRLQRFTYRDGILELSEQLLTDLNQRLRAVHVGVDGHIYVLTDSPQGALLRLSRAP